MEFCIDDKNNKKQVKFTFVKSDLTGVVTLYAENKKETVYAPIFMFYPSGKIISMHTDGMNFKKYFDFDVDDDGYIKISRE